MAHWITQTITCKNKSQYKTNSLSKTVVALKIQIIVEGYRRRSLNNRSLCLIQGGNLCLKRDQATRKMVALLKLLPLPKINLATHNRFRTQFKMLSALLIRKRRKQTLESVFHLNGNLSLTQTRILKPLKTSANQEDPENKKTRINTFAN